MGGLFLARDAEPAFAAAALDNARAQFARHGFAAPRERRIAGWRMLHSGYIIGGPETMAEAGEDFAIVAGTLAFDGLCGAAALRALLAEAQPPRLDWSRLGGQFILLLHKSGRTFLAGDYFGAFHLYHDREMRLFSTSLLAAATALPRVSLDPQGVYEFAFHAAVLGDDTVLREVRRLGRDRLVELTADGVRLHHDPRRLPGETTRMPLADRLARHRELLGALVAGYAGHFGDDIQCPLSGGLDSRLVLALLRAAGRRPRVYVYGPPDSRDVSIARRIGAAEGFDVAWIEKGRYRAITPDAFPEQVARNFHEDDGVPNFGGIFDNGGNAHARDARHRGGALAVSGGCGEIYRNFFLLPDRRISAANVAAGFFARFDPRDTTAEFAPRAYLRGVEDKILAALDRPGDRAPLPRPLVEQVYPLVRCRSLFGREISMEARYSPYLMPFIDHRIVAAAVTLPMRLKQAGAFEARLLNAIDPALARHPSAYGHDFATPPGARHRIDEWATRVRPFWLRRHSYALRRRLGPLADEHGGLLGPDYMARVIDLDFPAMRRFFRIDQVSDSGLWRRIACLEYFANHLGGRLGGG